ncbi:hypothetical protein CHI13_04230, partial [Bacillus paralicheniformis]
HIDVAVDRSRCFELVFDAVKSCYKLYTQVYSYHEKIPLLTGEDVTNVSFSIINIFGKIKLLVKEFKMWE